MKSLVASFLIVILTNLSRGGVVFVSPGGNDSNAGTQQKPFLTLERARDEVRSRRVGPGQGDTVWLLRGTYPRTETFVIGPYDGGIRGAPVVYAAWPGDEVRISGGMEIPAASFSPVRDHATLRRIPSRAHGFVMQSDLRAQGFRDFGTHRQYGHGLPVVPAPMELFWNDSVMQLARYPNEGGILLGTIVDPGSIPRIGDYSKRGGRFRYTDPRHARWTEAPGIWLQGFFNHGFADDKIRVAAIDTLRGEITFASPHMYGLGSGQNFNLYVALNLLEELDAPGEWYVDSARGRLYFWPPGPLAGARIVVSMPEKPLIALDHTSYVTLHGLIIECGRGIGLTLEGGEHNRIVDCVIRNMGTLGIMLGKGARQTFPHITADDYTGIPVSGEIGSYHSHLYVNSAWDRDAGRGHSIEGCEVYGTGSGGILLGGGNKKQLIPGGCSVRNCRIHDFNRRNKAGAAGVIVDGCGNRVVNSEIYDADLQAIIVHGNDHLFEYNHIHHVALNSNDASAWYLGRDPSDQGNIVRRNFFHHVGRPDRKWMMGVYCDDATCGVLIEQNVFYRVASYGTVYSNGGHDIVVRNNIFIEGYGPAYQLKSMWYDFGIDEIPYFFSEKGIYTRRLTESVDIRKPPYSERYPLLRDWLDLLPDGKTFVGMRPRRNVFENNVLVKYEETFRLVGKYAQCEFGENVVTQADPGFVDAASMDFRLKDDSVVYKELPGFMRIPFEQIGPGKR